MNKGGYKKKGRGVIRRGVEGKEEQIFEEEMRHMKKGREAETGEEGTVEDIGG
jgi:hypothetical protein